ncbi:MULTISPECIES: hypothetical protein [Pseudomonas]|uniref:hypothetical protein n=1 Tax=Pseudomonas TaxID=286 RepID=UPI001AE5E72D|nr:MULTISPECIES: hypothetical protein [Pseudomonas]MBP2085186.1 hypothetical protein [Pseudomonas sp. PvP089]MBP2089112.1 hypothetical protein [Pseudomonas sp. PvP088]MBP2224725.1 hypothetical protein [Pseudomonas putida]MDG9812425.1 hypothetical protein [Pseudomonas putida]HDS0997370.1 hypothetical protein [Pseudomonas putida]
MEDKAATIADALELLWMNQQAIRASTEELALWVKQRGSENSYQNTMIALQALDSNAEAIAQALQRLRS